MPLDLYSDIKVATKRAKEYLGKDVKLYRSTRKDKKYMVYPPDSNTPVHFGQMGYEDYTKHKDDKRRQSYLARATKIEGNWKQNKYSPNNLAIHILW
tara:strand:- start:10914 stop:11204 length:291 start_codon:yes stop_codon:yes gene_type:complete